MVSKQEMKPADISNWIYMETTQTHVWIIFLCYSHGGFPYVQYINQKNALIKIQ